MAMSNSDCWVPPLELQSLKVKSPDGSIYSLNFPIELKNKDYLRRILDVVAHGIQDTAEHIVLTRGRPIGSQFEPYDFKTIYDVYYLTKHILDNLNVYATGNWFDTVCSRCPLESCLEMNRCHDQFAHIIVLTIRDSPNVSSRRAHHLQLQTSFCLQNCQQRCVFLSCRAKRWRG